ncbi:hypothetical protein QC762_0073200 [Podospora pseudocomata]|uniref:Non-haem dioxygenase N-terminal domain-containing protein n=1 Tax=Podospora pseudocomata TaxID=2093779 RepID=A0ABR0G9L2_9PEZI|nr:hypothetical protein QC762_0073200 [Podospora pseudocomata]
MTFKMAIDTPTSSTKTLELEVVRYEQLRSNDNAEVRKLAQALSDQGMLFLDLQGSTAKQFLKDLQTVIQHQRAFFEQPQEEKSKYHTGIRYNGFYTSPIGVEKIHLGRKEQMAGDRSQLPEALQLVADKVKNVSSFIDKILREIGMTLASSMDERFPASLQDATRPGQSHLTLGISKARAGTPLMDGHTDDGFLTLTFYEEPFLEVLDRSTNEWKLVEVNRNMPILNVAAQSAKNSGGRLYNPWHRVKMGENEINLVMFDLFEDSN